MKKTLLLTTMLLSFGLMGSAQATFSSVKVNGEVISKTQLEQLALQAIQNNDPHQIIDPNFEGGVKKMAIENTVLAQEAVREGIDKDPAVQKAIHDNEEQILADYYRNQELAKNPITGFDLDKAYNDYRKEYGQTEVQFRAIVVKTEPEAKQILEDLKKGGNFAKLAAEKSIDPTHGNEGGVYTWRSLNLLPKEMGDALSKAKADQVVDHVVNLGQAYAVVELIGTRSAENIPPFEKLRKPLYEQLLRERNEAILKAVIDKSTTKPTDYEGQVKLMADAARQAGYDKLPDVKANIANMKNYMLSQALTQKVFKGIKVSEAELKKAYDDAKANYGKAEVRVRHIILKDEAKAKDVIERLNKGENFQDIAKKESADDSTKEDGGLLNWMSTHEFTQSLRAAIENMKKGEVYPTPVQSSVGWHVIRLDDVREPKNFPSFEESKQRNEADLIRRKYQAYVENKIQASDVVDLSPEPVKEAAKDAPKPVAPAAQPAAQPAQPAAK